jgi:hypothetical protein
MVQLLGRVLGLASPGRVDSPGDRGPEGPDARLIAALDAATAEVDGPGASR